MRRSRRTRDVSEGHCGLKPRCRYVLSYKAPWAHGGACCGLSGRAANKTAWEKKNDFFLFSAVQEAWRCVCVFAKPSMEQAEDEEQFTHLPLTLQSTLLFLGMEAFCACSENL